ncbi:PilN domain-containing protein [bacterium]|nr:PilN domain-containing protein [candidate division CSSED10-310 bacterium]
MKRGGHVIGMDWREGSIAAVVLERNQSASRVLRHGIWIDQTAALAEVERWIARFTATVRINLGVTWVLTVPPDAARQIDLEGMVPDNPEDWELLAANGDDRTPVLAVRSANLKGVMEHLRDCGIWPDGFTSTPAAVHAYMLDQADRTEPMSGVVRHSIGLETCYIGLHEDRLAASRTTIRPLRDARELTATIRAWRAHASGSWRQWLDSWLQTDGDLILDESASGSGNAAMHERGGLICAVGAAAAPEGCIALPPAGSGPWPLRGLTYRRLVLAVGTVALVMAAVTLGAAARLAGTARWEDSLREQVRQRAAQVELHLPPGWERQPELVAPVIAEAAARTAVETTGGGMLRLLSDVSRAAPGGLALRWEEYRCQRNTALATGLASSFAEVETFSEALKAAPSIQAVRIEDATTSPDGTVRFSIRITAAEGSS